MAPKSLSEISDAVWELPPSYKDGMRVPVRIYATRTLLERMEDGVFDQAANVAALPGIVGHSFCMPDGHWGYGFPIGGVAAFDARDGVISPGGIGFDINCGMRLVTTNLTEDEVRPKLETLVDSLFARIPAGVGGSGTLKLSRKEFRGLLRDGMRWALRNGFADEDDLAATEENGCVAGADPDAVGDRAMERGMAQVGTLGSGNHYLEIQVVRPENVVDAEAAEVMGVNRPNQIAIMIHCGSRGFGHQVAGDYLKRFLSVMQSEYGMHPRDKELACAPIGSPDGRAYFAAMNCAINMAFVNRQVILHRVREVFADVLGGSPAQLGIRQVYDVTHNTAKIERHTVEGAEMDLLVHRKGATRAFGPGMHDVPPRYAGIGQPVIIGGSMETGSYVLTGCETGAQTFYTTAHGSGRTMGRRAAKKRFRGTDVRKSMRERGIYVRGASNAGLAEEAGGAYKDIDEVVDAASRSGISRPVVKLVPIGNIKG